MSDLRVQVSLGVSLKQGKRTQVSTSWRLGHNGHIDLSIMVVAIIKILIDYYAAYQDSKTLNEEMLKIAKACHSIQFEDIKEEVKE